MKHMNMPGSASPTRPCAAPRARKERQPRARKPRVQEPGSSLPPRKDLREPRSQDPGAPRGLPSGNQLRTMVPFGFIDCPCRFCFNRLSSQDGKRRGSWLGMEGESGLFGNGQRKRKHANARTINIEHNVDTRHGKRRNNHVVMTQ